MPPAERILAAAVEREALFRKIAATQHAKASLGQLAPQIADLTNKQFDATQLYSTLVAATREKEEAADKLRDHGHLRKLLKREKHEAEVQRAENVYLQATVWSAKAQVKMGLIDSDLAALKVQRDALLKADAEHRTALVSLDDLYASVYEGPTLDVPEEDALEAAVQSAQAKYDEIQGRLAHAAAVVNHLSTARAKVSSALDHIRAGLEASTADIIDYNGPRHHISAPGSKDHRYPSVYADRRERYELSWVQRQLTEAEHSVALARQMDPEHVGNFFRPQVATGDNSVAGILDQVVNTPLTDYLFHAEIEDTLEGVQQCHMLLQQEVGKAEARQAAIDDGEKKPAEAALEEGRQHLLDFRIELFEKALREQDGNKDAQPPSYTKAAGDGDSAAAMVNI